MTTKHCPACRGTKNVMGLGLIYHDCTACHGVGFVKDEDEVQHEKIVHEEIKETNVVRKFKKSKNAKKDK
jgi:DnaJ-class molecular chaperone